MAKYFVFLVVSFLLLNGIFRFFKVKLDTEFEKRSPFKCGSFGASSFQSRHLATGDFEGRLSLWDLENTTLPVSLLVYCLPLNLYQGILGRSTQRNC